MSSNLADRVEGLDDDRDLPRAFALALVLGALLIGSWTKYGDTASIMAGLTLLGLAIVGIAGLIAIAIDRRNIETLENAAALRAKEADHG